MAWFMAPHIGDQIMLNEGKLKVKRLSNYLIYSLHYRVRSYERHYYCAESS